MSKLSSVKERPILMTPENAQKCHDGTKTQTRRTNGLEVVNHAGTRWGCPQMTRPGVATFLDLSLANPYDNALDVVCPYGVVGDRLWVREAWQEKAWTLTELNRASFLNAPMKPKETYLNNPIYAIHRGGYNNAIGDPGRWFPSIHMPRWACRTVLEITALRAERLHDISPSDALAEGIFCPEVGYAQHGGRAPVLLYGFLWESINGKNSWERNDWVWVVSFKKVKVIE